MRIFQEKGSGIRTRRPALDELLTAVREEDVVVVNRLARLELSTGHTIQLVEEFNRRGIHFRAQIVAPTEINRASRKRYHQERAG